MRYILILTLTLSQLLGQPGSDHKCGFGNHSTSFQKRSAPQARGLDFLDESVVSPSGEFRIHFTRSGSHAVAFSNANSTPDFVVEAALAADSAYSILVNELGFLPPMSDAGVDGDELDIYIVDMKLWEGSYYGMTYFSNSAPSPTYLTVDNDYVENFYATSGLEALQVTIAHEFFHMVQLHYAHPSEPGTDNVFWYEISSTWFEEVCYPEVDDYHAYVRSNFQASRFPALNSFASSYGHAVYGLVLDIEYGTRSNIHIMRDLWEHLDGSDALENLDDRLSQEPWNSSLAHSLDQYAVYNSFTGYRAIPGVFYPDAAELPEVRTKDYSLSMYDLSEFNHEVHPLSIVYTQFTPQNTSIQYTSKTEATIDEGLSHQQILMNSNGSYSVTPVRKNQWGENFGFSTGSRLMQVSTNSNLDIKGEYTIQMQPQLDFLTAWPNPINPDHNSLNFCFINVSTGSSEIIIYNILGQNIYEDQQNHPLGYIESNVFLPENLPQGIYFIQLVTIGKSVVGKFTVLK